MSVASGWGPALAELDPAELDPAADRWRHRRRAMSESRFYPLILGLAMFVAFGLVAEAFYLAFAVTNSPTPVATFFPPAGLTFAAILLTRPRYWPYLAVGICSAEVVVDLANGVDLWTSLSWGVANSVEPMVSAVIVRHFVGPEERRGIGSVRSLVTFVGAAVITGPAVGATIALTTSGASGTGELLGFFARWWTGDGVSVLVIAPVLLTLADRRRSRRAGRANAAVLACVVGVSALGIFAPLEQGTLAYFVLPVMIWLAFVADQRATALGVLVVALMTNAATLAGVGPFSADHSVFGGLVNAQIFLGTVTFSALFVGVLSARLLHRAEVEAMLREQALRDILTGAGNRRLLFERLATMGTAATAGSDRTVAFLVIDLDDFKTLNDTHGHACGDAVLVETARRLGEVTRPSDLVVRLGGDEFLVCVDRPMSPADVDSLVSRTSRLLAMPIVWGDTVVRVGASIGVAVAPMDDVSPDELLRRADVDMYAAKRARAARAGQAPA